MYATAAAEAQGGLQNIMPAQNAVLREYNPVTDAWEKAQSFVSNVLAAVR